VRQQCDGVGNRYEQRIVSKGQRKRHGTYRIVEEYAAYFMTFSVVEWLPCL